MQTFDLERLNNWRKADESDDAVFYSEPRLVVHVDDNFIATLGKFLREHLPPGGVILDLMSSYKSHLPPDYQPQRVIGLGMNATEMQANRQLDEHVVQNLNLNPQLPFKDGLFDAVLNTVSIQYLQRPVEVLREVGRVLKPGALHIVSFSNRMFPSKAVQIWRELDEPGRVVLVEQYFEQSGMFEPAEIFRQVSPPSGNWWSGLFNSKDPVYIVYARRK
jgi:SAM-dependent methyltransferase